MVLRASVPQPLGGVFVQEPATSMVSPGWMSSVTHIGWVPGAISPLPAGRPSSTVRPEAPVAGVNFWLDVSNRPLTTPVTVNSQPAAETFARTFLRRAGQEVPVASAVIATLQPVVPEMVSGATVVAPAMGLLQAPVPPALSPVSEPASAP